MELDLVVSTGVEPTVLWAGGRLVQNLWDASWPPPSWLTPLGASTLYTNGDYVIFLTHTGSVSPAVNIDANVYSHHRHRRLHQ